MVNRSFPLTDKNFNQNEFIINQQFLKLLNKLNFYLNDETRHYLSGIYFHQTEVEDKNYLQLLRLIAIECQYKWLNKKIGEPIILPKKLFFSYVHYLLILTNVKISNAKSKIKFEIRNILISS